MRYIKYLVYVLKHKWFVFIGCVKTSVVLNMPELIWLGFIHDWSKFRWSEFRPYANHFYGPDAEAYKNREKEDEAFAKAWLYHQNRNRHHWQFFLSVDRKKKITVAEMPIKYTEEMLADWIGAAKAKGQGEVYTVTWYERYRTTMVLETRTRRWVENAVSRMEEKSQ